jgi:thiol-disulfide isomerase/thioredoxin
MDVRSRLLGTLASCTLLLTACGALASPTSPATTATGSRDFRLVAYQGAAVFGGKQSNFARVFDQKKPVILNFWAGLCPPCRAEMPGFQKVSTDLSGKVLFVGIDIGPFVDLGNHQDAINLYTQLGIHYPLAYAVDSSPLQLYRIQGMPTTVFLSSSGRVVDQETGIVTEDQLRTIIQQKLLASG